MKKISSIFIMMAMLSSCGNNTQNKALSDAKETATAIKQMLPGGVAAATGSWTMTAKIGGQDWAATSLIPPERADKIFGDNNGENISLPYQRGGMVVGKKITFSKATAVDMIRHDEVSLWEGYAGEMEITKADGEWIEGTFHFTASAFGNADKTLEVTDGFFRVSIAQKR